MPGYPTKHNSIDHITPQTPEQRGQIIKKLLEKERAKKEKNASIKMNDLLDDAGIVFHPMRPKQNSDGPFYFRFDDNNSGTIILENIIFPPGTNLENVYFSQCALLNVRFENIIFGETCFRGAVLINTIIADPICPGCIDMTGATVKNISITGNKEMGQLYFQFAREPGAKNAEQRTDIHVDEGISIIFHEDDNPKGSKLFGKDAATRLALESAKGEENRTATTIARKTAQFKEFLKLASESPEKKPSPLSSVADIRIGGNATTHREALNLNEKAKAQDGGCTIL